ncbi:MAG: CRTAC1 family protein [Acidobacteriota bacterium]
MVSTRWFRNDLSLALAAAVAFSSPLDAGPLDTAAPFRAQPGWQQPTHQIALDYLGTGQGWADLDSDGCPDLIVTSGTGGNSLWRGRCDGTFEQVLDPAVAQPQGESAGVSFADYDNDGDTDVYLLQRGQNRLLRNRGDGRFDDVTALAGVGDPGQGQSAAWGDFDFDGDLDLYVVNWFYYYEITPLDRDGFYRNNGDGTFTDVSSWFDRPTLERPGFAASFVDYDNDGDLDLYVVNDKTQGNPLWRNDGAGCAGWCFTEVSVATGAARPAWGMGLAIGDYDHDGDLDFYYSSISEAVLLQNQISQGSDSFIERSIEAGVSPDLTTSWGTFFFDYDNDGWLDLYLATINSGEFGGQTDRLYSNSRDGTFADVSEVSGCSDTSFTVGAAMADYNLDGWVDMVVGNYGEHFQLFENRLGANGSENRWLRVHVEGGGPVDRDALGTRVVVHTSDGLSHLREKRSGSSIGAGDERILHVGLGTADITGIDVRFLDGETLQLGPVTPGQVLTVRHPRWDELLVDDFESGDTMRWSSTQQP